MDAQREVSQRDLRLRSKEIMATVERGDSFAVTRDGRRIGELIPLSRGRRFVSRSEFARASQQAPRIDLLGFRADQDAALVQEPIDPYAW